MRRGGWLSILAAVPCIALCAQTTVNIEKVSRYSAPKGYGRDDSRAAGGRIGFYVLSKDEYTTNITIRSLKTSETSAVTFGREALPSLKKDPEMKILGTKTFQVGGTEAFGIASERQVSKTMTVDQYQVIAIRKGILAIFTFSTLKKNYAREWPMFMASLKSVRWAN